MKTFAYIVRRVFAFGTDWYISAVLINLMTNALGHFISGEYSVHIALLLTSLLISFLYYVLVPCKVWMGQTLMMRAMHIKVVDVGGSDIDMMRMFLRFFVGCLIIEGAFYIPSVNIRSVLAIMYPNNWWPGLTFVINATSVLGLCVVCLNWREFRLLHDLMFHTKVIDSLFGSSDNK